MKVIYEEVKEKYVDKKLMKTRKIMPYKKFIDNIEEDFACSSFKSSVGKDGNAYLNILLRDLKWK